MSCNCKKNMQKTLEHFLVILFFFQFLKTSNLQYVRYRLLTFLQKLQHGLFSDKKTFFVFSGFKNYPGLRIKIIKQKKVARFLSVFHFVRNPEVFHHRFFQKKTKLFCFFSIQKLPKIANKIIKNKKSCSFLIRFSYICRSHV